MRCRCSRSQQYAVCSDDEAAADSLDQAVVSARTRARISGPLGSPLPINQHQRPVDHTSHSRPARAPFASVMLVDTSRANGFGVVYAGG
jgi:hypothetical protein